MKREALIVGLIAVGASSLSAAQEYSGMVAAAAEFSALIMLIKGLIILVGGHTCGYAIVQAVRANNERGQENSPSSYLTLFIIGVCMISIGLSISVASNTLFGSDGKSEIAQDLINDVAINPDAMMQFVQQSTIFQSQSLQGQVQQRILAILLMAVMLGGWYAIWRGFRIARVALSAGSDMGGTSLAHRMPAVWGHILGGIALINIESTLGLASTFGTIMLRAIVP